MEFLIPLMPLFGALPLAVAAVVIARMFQRRRDAPVADLEAAHRELQAELDALRAEFREMHERVDFTERVLAQQRRGEPLPPAD
jgi:hypothetical protein